MRSPHIAIGTWLHSRLNARAARRGFGWALAVVGALGASGGAWAQIRGVNLQCEMDSSHQVTVRDRDNGRTLISPNRQAVWGPDGRSAAAKLRPHIEFEARPDGYNVVYTFVNTTGKRASIGEFYVPGIRFGSLIGTRDFKVDGKAATINHNNGNYAGGGLWYPETMYAPVAVVSQDGYTIGASLHYPILEYKHRVFVRVESPGGQFIYPNRNWQILFRLNPSNPNEGGYSPEGEIAPGETRRYVLAVRVLKHAEGQHQNEWLRTLEPYRRYFKRMYGDVKYERDPRPVLGVAIANGAHLAPDNRMGFSPYQRFRADKYGFGPWVELLNQYRASGYERAMIWAPSGLFYKHRESNYPFQFTSRWKALPEMRRSVRELQQLAATGYDLGLWWGRSAQVMTSWDTDQMTRLNPQNNTHRRLAFEELDGAAAAGAKLVGLDTFTFLPIWEGYPWLVEMQSRRPQIKFVIEPVACDIYHTLAASYTLGTTSQSERPAQVTSPHLLADFLNPGHETWSVIHAGHIREQMGLPYTGDVTPDQLQREVSKISTMGYVPVPFASAPLPGPIERYHAAETWKRTTPEGDYETLQAAAPAAPSAPAQTTPIRVRRTEQVAPPGLRKQAEP